MRHHDRIDFLCIGAAKAGTTWLFEMLREHADTLLPAEKELHYFNPWHGEFGDRPNPRHALTYSWYHGFFPDHDRGKILGEFSTSYLKYAEAAAKIHEYHSDIKLLAILRHPIERAISHHAFLYAQGMPVSVSFSRAWNEWPTLLTHGLYFRQLEPYRRLFGSEHLMVLSYDDILERPQELVDQVCDFLGLARFVPTKLNTVVNPTLQVRDPKRHRRISALRAALERWRLVGAAARYLRLSEALARLQRSNLHPGQRNEPLEPELRRTLAAFFRDDLLALQQAYPGRFDDWDL